MRIPLLKVVDTGYTNGSTSAHIVGTNHHDTLHIDEHGGLQYMNLQCCEGTRKWNGKDGDYHFAAKTNEYFPYPKIEFVSIETFLKIIGGQAKLKEYPELQALYDVHCNEMMKLLNESYNRSQRKFKRQMLEIMCAGDDEEITEDDIDKVVIMS